MKERVEDYLRSKAWEYKPEGDDLYVRQCPFCFDDKWHFSIHSTMGYFQCFKCSEKGNLYTLKKALGDIGKIGEASQVEEIWGKDLHYDLIPVEDVDRLHRALLADDYSKNWVY